MPAKVANVRWKCPQCGKSRWLKPAVARAKKYCSRECQYAAARKSPEERVRKYPYAAKKLHSGLICPRCGKTFDTLNGNQLYCSRECQLAAARDKYLESVNSRQREVTCENCGKNFTARAGGTGRFCSRECLYDSMRGEKSAHWKGGKHITGDGYIKIHVSGHPDADRFGYVSEHRYVMEQVLGRPLRQGENVHHRNGEKTDNRPENLELWLNYQPKGQRVTDLVAYAKWVLEEYGALTQGALKL